MNSLFCAWVSRRSLGYLCLAGLMTILAGCGSENPMGSVSGKVTYKGQPITTGFVNFYDPARGMGAQGKLDENGAFTLETRLDAGKYKVFLQPPVPEQLPPGTVAPKKAPFNYPSRIQDGGQTPNTEEVKPGTNMVTIDFKG